MVLIGGHLPAGIRGLLYGTRGTLRVPFNLEIRGLRYIIDGSMYMPRFKT